MFLRFIDGMAFRVAALLTVAFFPIGVIALSLSNQITQQNDRRAEATLLALTSEAAASEESLVRGAFGAAAAFVATIDKLRQDPDACNAMFSQYLVNNPDYSFAGYVDNKGVVTCASAGVGTDTSQGAVYPEMSLSPKQRADVNLVGPISGTSVIVLSVPVMKDGVFDGYVAISLPHLQIFQSIGDLSPAERPIDLITFNEDGDILSAEGGFSGVESRLPQNRSLGALAGSDRFAFTARNEEGAVRVFAVVPIVENKIYAIGSWSGRELSLGSPFGFGASLLFPALMWLTSLGVAYFAVHRLALNHIRRIGREMDVFARTRAYRPAKPRISTPLEIRSVEASWNELAETMLREEAELEGTIHDKNVLLKEVHHRVKNNLQLISSIVNMKVRKATTPEARVALKEVQMRVMSIATVHRSLYETSTEGRVRADELLRTIVDKTIEGGLLSGVKVDITRHFEPVELYPDQAVPLSLMASETVTNALKYLGRTSDGVASIHVNLKMSDGNRAIFSVRNSCGDPITPPDQVRGTGLGASLIRAFTQQIGGTVDIEETATDYSVVVDFPIVEFDDTPVDAAIEPSA